MSSDNKETMTSTSTSTSTSSKCETKTERKCFKYLSGFGNEHQSEALEGTLPVGQNNPQKCAYGLYAEQLNGTSFTTPRVYNQRIWFYRIKPIVVHKPFKPYTDNKLLHSDFSKGIVYPNQIRWNPFPLPDNDKKVDFVEGLSTLGGSGSPDIKSGFAIHIYTANTSMKDKAFVNSDGDLLIVPQQGELTIQTECGFLHVAPNEICVIQRGHHFSVDLQGPSRGYVCEVFNGHFRIPDLGPIGANGLANPRDFKYPVAHYDHQKNKFTIVQKFIGQLFTYDRDSTVFDVVAWHGNYAPYKYNLADFIVINSVSRDHLDPSIFTVLTCPTSEPGVACIDFVIFPPRWAVQEKTFRPPYYHRNCMSEFMGNIMGRYEAKPDGFLPGGGSLHSCMIGHGPDTQTYEKSSKGELKPVKLPEDSMSFMFESTYMIRLTEWGMKHHDSNYYKVWESLTDEFDPTKKNV